MLNFVTWSKDLCQYLHAIANVKGVLIWFIDKMHTRFVVLHIGFLGFKQTICDQFIKLVHKKAGLLILAK